MEQPRQGSSSAWCVLHKMQPRVTPSSGSERHTLDSASSFFVQLSMAQANDEVWRLARRATEAAGHPSGGAGASENGARENVEPYDRLGTPSLPMGQLKALHIGSPTDNPLADVRALLLNITEALSHRTTGLQLSSFCSVHVRQARAWRERW